MTAGISTEAQDILRERFGHDCLIALATMEGDRPWVRTVNSYYEDGAFYVITHGRSNKMRQLEANPQAALCGDWFTGQGTGENLGHILSESNRALAEKLRQVFAAWYQNGHMDESDPETCILRIRLTQGVLMSHGVRYDLHFSQEA